MIKNKRQMSPTLDGIRDDHLERYRFAARIAKLKGCHGALDVGCGCGYGSFVLAEAGLIVWGYDLDPLAIEYGDEHYSHERIHRYARDLSRIRVQLASAVVMFEIIEHSKDSPAFLARAHMSHNLLILSVPNQNVVPFGPKSHPDHYRHYTPDQLESELDASGWRPVFRGSQKGKRGSEAQIIENDTSGRTLVYVAESSLREVDGFTDLGGPQ